MPDTITIEVTREQGRYLLESIAWSLQAAERTLDKGNHTQQKNAAEKYRALDDVLAQLQEVKRDRWVA